MSAQTEEYINGRRPGPLTREMPECMRNKPTILHAILDCVIFLLTAAGHIVNVIFRCIVGQRKKDLKGGIAVVTGAGGGLGSLIALRLARLNVTVVVWDINKKGVEDTVKLVKGIGGNCHGYVVDLCNREEVYAVAKKVEQEVGRVTLLINNAGVVSGTYLLETPDHLIQRTFDVNIISHFWTVKAFLPSMIEHNDGHIVSVASMAGHVGVSKLVDYCASKAAACGFDEALNMELAELGATGIHTTVICPFFIRSTGMFEQIQSRVVPVLNPNDVADRVVLAIRTNEHVAIIPGYLRLLLPFKWIVPRAVSIDFLRKIVPDASPAAHSSTAPEEQKPVAAADIAKSSSRPMSLTPPSRPERQV